MNSGRTRTPTSVSRHSIASIAVIVKTTLMMLVVTVMKVSVLRRTFCIGINAGDDDGDERYIPPKSLRIPAPVCWTPHACNHNTGKVDGLTSHPTERPTRDITARAEEDSPTPERPSQTDRQPLQTDSHYRQTDSHHRPKTQHLVALAYIALFAPRTSELRRDMISPVFEAVKKRSDDLWRCE